MSYLTLARMAKDSDFIDRITACAATQGIRQADIWAADNRWAVAGQPGFDDAYSYAVEVGHQTPGQAPDVIPDAMILAAVQHLLTGRSSP